MHALLFGGFRRCELGLGFLLSLGLFKILDGEFELLDQQLAALRRLPELFSSCLGQHQLQPLDLQPANGHFAPRQRQLLALRNDHRVCCGKVGGKRIGWRRHEDESTIFVAKNPARFNRKPVDARLPAASANQFRRGDRIAAQR